jgi:hypothetical protein
MASITLDEAFKQAVKSFYDGSGFEEYEKVKGKSKYSHDMFSNMEKGIRKGLRKDDKNSSTDTTDTSTPIEGPVNGGK